MTSISFPPVAVPVSRLASTSRAHSRSPRYPRSALALWLGCAVAAFAGTSPELELSIGLPSTNNWTQLRLAGATNVAWTIEASEDLSAWSDIARLHALDYMPFWSDPTILFFQDAAAPDHVRRFYRASTAPVGPENVVAEHVLLQLATTKRLPTADQSLEHR